MKWLLSNRAKVDAKDSHGRTPADMAEQFQHRECQKLLSIFGEPSTLSFVVHFASSLNMEFRDLISRLNESNLHPRYNLYPLRDSIIADLSNHSRCVKW